MSTTRRLGIVVPLAAALAWALGASAWADGEEGIPGIVATLKGHTETLYGLAFSPDGRYVVSASFDKTLKIWDVATGKETRTLGGSAGHQSLVLAVACSANGLFVASGGSDNTAKIWEGPGFVTRKELAAAVAETAFNADPRRIYFGGLDGKYRLWKLATAVPLKSFAHPNLVDAVAFDPAGKLLATGCHDGAVRIWNVATGQQVRQINAHSSPPAPVYCLAWTADGKAVVSGSMDHTMKLWDAGSGALVREFKKFKEKEFAKGHRDAVFCLALSPDGRTLASGSSDHGVKLWNLATGQVTGELENPALRPLASAGPKNSHPGWVYGVRFTPDGKHLISAGNAPRNRGYLAVWNVANRKLEREKTLDSGAIYALGLTPKGDLFALGGQSAIVARFTDLTK